MGTERDANLSDLSPTEMRQLYEKDPDLFAELAKDAIRQACIGRVPEQTLKLRQMQWVIEAQLRKGTTPLQKMQIMENIFYGQLYGDNGYLDKLATACAKFLQHTMGYRSK